MRASFGDDSNGGVLVAALRYAAADTAPGPLTLDAFRNETPATGPPHP